VSFVRSLNDGAEIRIEQRVYRVRTAEHSSA